MISFAGFVIHFLGCSRKGMVKKEYSKSENEIDDHAKILNLRQNDSFTPFYLWSLTVVSPSLPTIKKAISLTQASQKENLTERDNFAEEL